MIEVAKLRRRLLLVVGAVALLGLVVEVWHSRSHDALIEALLTKLSLSYEGNLPTWLSSAVLLLCAIAAGAIANARPPWHRHWWGIVAILTWMSIDEAVELHEHLGGHIEANGIFYYDWVIPAAGILVVLGIVYLPFLRALDPRSRMRLVIAGAIYIGGALVMELPLGNWAEQHGTDGLGYGLIDWVEETMEMVGASLALVALVAHRQEMPKGHAT